MSKKLIGLIVVMALGIFLFPSVAYARTAVTQTIYTQPPNPAGGIYHSSWWDPNGSDYDQYVWDGFVITTGASITEVRWRGAFDPTYFGSGGAVVDFTVSIHASIAGGSQPDVIAPPLVRYHTGGDANQTPAGTAGGVTMYDYSFTLPTAFTAAPGTKYWVQIEAYQHGIPDWSIASASSGDGKYFRRTAGVGDTSYQLVPGDAAFTLIGTRPVRTRFDFDGDGQAEVSVFRPSTGMWYTQYSSNGQFVPMQWGLATDYIMPGDYDGDGKTDVAVWREGVDGIKAYCYIFNSATSTMRFEQFGQDWDVMEVGDWDGDGVDDPAVYRDSGPGTQSYFYYRGSLNNPTGIITFVPWGMGGDIPVQGDFDGDGKRDAAIFRPSENLWYIRESQSQQMRVASWGLSTDKLVPSDCDGDGKTDLAVYRDGMWYYIKSSDGSMWFMGFGLSTDIPIPADYDGDGKADFAVFRDGTWYAVTSSNMHFHVRSWGIPGDRPIPAAYLR